jgi:ubiquitin-protein ligase
MASISAQYDKCFQNNLKKMYKENGSGNVWIFPHAEDIANPKNENGEIEFRVFVILEDFFVDSTKKTKMAEKHFAVIMKFKLPIKPIPYPHSPPIIKTLSNTGRWITNNNICTTFTHYHSESWTPTWTIRKIIVALTSCVSDPEIIGIGWNRYDIDAIKSAQKQFQKSWKDCSPEYQDLEQFFAKIDNLDEIRGK